MTTAVPHMRALRAKDPAPPRKLTEAQVAQFDRDGFLCPLDGISEQEAFQIRQELEKVEQDEKKSGNALFTNGHLLRRWQYELATKPQILDMVQDLIGPDFYIWKHQCWIKEPHSEAVIGWHQDAKYWGLEPPDTVNVWLALSDVKPENGPMEFYAGSHAEPLLDSVDTYTADNMLTRGQIIPFLEDEATRDNSWIVQAVIRPGQFSLHHLGTAHGGGPNRGQDRRIGFNVTYCAASVRNVRTSGQYGMPVRGCQPLSMLGGMNIDPPPEKGGPSAENLAAYKLKAKGLGETVMSDADMDQYARVLKERETRNLPAFLTAQTVTAKL